MCGGQEVSTSGRLLWCCTMEDALFGVKMKQTMPGLAILNLWQESVSSILLTWTADVWLLLYHGANSATAVSFHE